MLVRIRLVLAEDRQVIPRVASRRARGCTNDRPGGAEAGEGGISLFCGSLLHRGHAERLGFLRIEDRLAYVERPFVGGVG